MKRSGLCVPAEGAAWRNVADQFWRQLFCIEKFETDNRKFAGEILTDGKGVSMVMRKPKSLERADKDVLWDDLKRYGV